MTRWRALLQSPQTLFKASLSQQIVLWVFASIITIEVIILVPSVYRRQHELLQNLREISAAKASGILDMKPTYASDAELLEYISYTQNNKVVLGGRLYANGREVGTFGEPPDLTWADIVNRKTVDFQRAKARYDAVWQMSSLAAPYTLVIRHDASFVNREFYYFILRISGLVVIISIFVTGATMVILNRMVITPICRLRQDLVYAGDVISREELDPLPRFMSIPTQRRDELGEVTMAFGQMIDQIAKAIAQRKQAEKTIERLAEIGELSSMIVHEVRNPLTTVLMGLHSFRNMDLSDRARTRLTLALEESERLQRLLNEILMYAKEQTLELEPLNLNEMVTELATALRDQPGVCDRHLHLSLSPQPVWIQADRDKLKQVCINLVSNACEAVRDGETIAWSVMSSDRPGYTHICIHNGGDPIPADILPKLTRPFFTTKSSGNGLGLAITKRIIEAHSGRLWIESTQETGTTVTVCLPCLPTAPHGLDPTLVQPQNPQPGA
ncbi:MAG: HAMP domain-containing sensor histidine kinase [Leptolyngbyaceae bacterium]|nr:HAMP domain-containing sensor histidine kinase [Leptolyngbyaceae bacterium]